MENDRELQWKVLSAGAGILVGLATKRTLMAAWGRAVGGPAPTNPADRRTGWGSALAWAAGSGAAVGVTRMVAARVAAAAWEAAVGEPPPGLEVEPGDGIELG